MRSRRRRRRQARSKGQAPPVGAVRRTNNDQLEVSFNSNFIKNMYPHIPRDDYNIREITFLVRTKAAKYHNQVRALRDEQDEYDLPDDVYYRILREIRTGIFTELHAGLRGLYSARLTRKWFKHISMLTINERSHSWDARSPLPVRYITGIVEGLWDMINTETHFVSP